MTGKRESEVEVDLYEEIINFNYSTPMASRASSPFPHEKNESSMTHFNGPIVNSSEIEVLSTSIGLVASVTWPALRYPCSLAGNFQEPQLLMHPGGNRATLAPNVGLEVQPLRTGILDNRPNVGFEGQSKQTSLPEDRLPNVALEVLSISASSAEQRPNARLETESIWISLPQNRPNVALEC